MKSKIKLFIAMLFISITTMAQSPDMINYQGVARNTNGSAIANKNIKVRLKMRQGTVTGTVKYSEVRSITTDASGLFNIQIGSAGANTTTGSWGAIKWETGEKFLQVEMDATGGNNFTDMGTQQLLSVPYAQYANTAGSLKLPFIVVDTISNPTFTITNNKISSNSQVIKAITTNGIGILGESSAGVGVKGYSNSDIGVFGSTLTGTGVKAFSYTGFALDAIGKVKISGGNTNPGYGKVLTSDFYGNATWQTLTATPKVAFKVKGATTSYPDNTSQLVSFNTVSYNKGNNFSPGANKFIAPVAGLYSFSAATDIYLGSLLYNMISPSILICVKRNNNEFIESEVNGTVEVDFAGSGSRLQITCDIALLPNDEVFVRVNQFNGQGLTAVTNNFASSINYFSGHLVFAD